jgi:hypothetical protein
MTIYSHSAGDRTPFTYLLYCKSTNQVYYGVRYAKGCHPDQLWTSYFSSSTYVQKLREQYGDDDFEFQIRKIFNDPEKALQWENKVLRRMKAPLQKTWINMSNGINLFLYDRKPLSVDQRLHLSIIRKGKLKTDEWKNNISKAKKGNKSKSSLWLILYDDGSNEIVFNLKRYFECKNWKYEKLYYAIKTNSGYMPLLGARFVKI